jgi:hypothetical protein
MLETSIERTSSNLYSDYGAPRTAIGLGTGPIYGELMIELIGMQQSLITLVAGIFAAVLPTSITGLWRRLLCLKEANINSELQV